MSSLILGRDGALYGTTSDGGAGTYGTVFKIGNNGTDFKVLHAFSTTGGDGVKPRAGLVQGTDGALYGTTSSGGGYSRGTVFKLNADGGAYTVLHSFTGTSGDGLDPEAELIQGRDGAFYGTTYGSERGSLGLGYGTVFKLHGDGSGYTVLYSFTANVGDGRNPRAGLIQGNDGALYGTTYYGGAYTNWGHVVYTNWGTVFKINTDGTSYKVLYSFKGSEYDGNMPRSALVQGRDGAMYGTTYWGGLGSGGTIFKINPDGSGYTRMYSFSTNGTDGFNPQAALIQGPDDLLYGTAWNGGSNSYGTVFKVKTNGLSFATLHSFRANTRDGQNPPARVLQLSDGTLYGTTYWGGTCNWGTIFKLSTNGAPYTSLYSLGVNDPLGQAPNAELVQGDDGTFYGTVLNGGPRGAGTVFKVNPDGTGATVLYSFSGAAGDAQWPYAAVILGAGGALYGTTGSGGTNGAGTVFRLSIDGSGFTLLHSFCTNGADGMAPDAPVVQGADGALYGTTYSGGSNGVGVVYTLNTNGTGYQVLHSFNTNGVDGQNTRVGLVLARDGALYGTTINGGTNGCGTIFKLGTNGSGYTLLHTFASTGGDGYYPNAALGLGSDGALYGTTLYGGTNNYGAVFRLGLDGSDYRVIYSFPSGLGLGVRQAVGPLASGSDGALYGASYLGGTNGQGAVFKLNTNGTGFTLLYSFSTNACDGAHPYAGVVQGQDGAWYGTTSLGGSRGCGTVFRVGTPPVIMSHPCCRTNLPHTLATFAVTAVGALPLGFQWQKDGTDLLEGGNVSGSMTATLSLANVFTADDGNYMVVVTNWAGSVTSQPATLALSPVPWLCCTTSPQDGTVQLSLTCLPGFTYRIDASTNLLHWVLVTNFLIPDGEVQFIDPGASNFPQRFYRAGWTP